MSAPPYLGSRSVVTLKAHVQGPLTLCLVGATAAGRDRVDAAATSHSRRRDANLFHYRLNGARRAHRRPTSLPPGAEQRRDCTGSLGPTVADTLPGLATESAI